MATFGERIKGLRQQKGLTQRQMADTFGITERNYQRYEATDSPSNDTLIKLAAFFGVTTDYLLGRADYKYRYNTEGDMPADKPVGIQSVLTLDTDKLKRDLANSDNYSHRLQVLFEEPLQSYAVWLRNAGIPISGGGNSGMVVVEIEEDEFFDISDNLDAILQMSKDHFKMLARQLGKRWP